MNHKRDTWCVVAMLVVAILVLYKHFLATPIRWDFIQAYGSHILFIIQPGTLTRHVGAYFLLAALWFAGWGAGHRLLRALKPSADLPGELLSTWAASLLIGWGMLSHGLVLLAALHVLKLTWVAALLALGCGIGLWELLDVLKTGPSLRERLLRLLMDLPRSFDGLAVLVVCSFLLVGSFFSSLMPPTQSDALRYHLTTPKIWLQHGGFCCIPNISFSNFPMTIDILYAVPLAFGLPSVAKLIHWSFLLASLGMLHRMGQVFGNRAAARLSAVLFVTIPFVPILASWAFIEMGLCAYLLLTVAAALQLVTELRPSWKTGILLGLAGGWLLGCKYTSLIFLVLLLVFLVMPRRLFGVPSHRPRRAILAGVLSLLVASPWYVKNLIYNGNPVYPMGIGIFGEREWTSANAAFFSYHAGMKGDLNAALYLSLPGKLMDTSSLLVRPLWSPIDVGTNRFGDWPVSALFVILLPSLAHGTGKRWPGRFLSTYGGVLFMVWAWTYRDARFILAPLSILAVPISTACTNLPNGRAVVRGLVLLLVVYYGLWNLGKLCDYQGFAPWLVVSGAVDEGYYLRSVNQTTRSFYHGFEAVDQLVPPGARILIHGQHYAFHCPRPFVGADWFDTPPLIQLARKASSVEDLVGVLQWQGISFILHDSAEIERYNTVGLPAYWLMCLPPDQAVAFLQQLRDLEPIRCQCDPRDWYRSPKIRELHTLIGSAIEADPGWRLSCSFLESPYLETLYNRNGVRLARIRR